MKDLSTLNTVEEVESLRCFECARDGHWGWCDAPWIKCEYKDRIKEILGLSESRFSSLKEQMPDIITDKTLHIGAK